MKRIWLLALALLLIALVLPAHADRFVANGRGTDWKPTANWTRVSGSSDGRLAPGTHEGRGDEAEIPDGVTIVVQGPLNLDKLKVDGNLEGQNSKTDINVKAKGNIDVGATGVVGGGPGSNRGVSLVGQGMTTIDGVVRSDNKPAVVSGKSGIRINGTVRSNGSNANVYSDTGSVHVAGRLIATKQVNLNAGRKDSTVVDGQVESERGDVVINGGSKPQPPKPTPPGNVHVGWGGSVKALHGEVVIYADTLFVDGTIEGKTVQKHCNKVIIRGSGVIKGKGSEIDYEKEKKAEEHPPEKPAEEARKQFSIGPQDARFELSAFAIRATESVLVAGGPGSTIDLTSNVAGWPSIECPGPIQLNADSILLPPGVPIEAICGPGPVTVGPGGPVRKVATYPLWVDEAYTGMPLEVHFGVQNLGNVPETVEITLTDSLGWGPLTPFGPIDLGSLADYDTTLTMPWPVPPWAIPDVDTNSLRLRVRSLLDPTIEYTEDVLIPVRDPLTLRDATVAPFQVVAPHAGEPTSIVWWVENTGFWPLAIDMLVEDELGWGFEPPAVAFPLEPAADLLLTTSTIVPPGLPDGIVNRVVVRLSHAGEPLAADTVEVVVGALTGVAGDPPPAAGLRHGCQPNPFNPAVEIWFELPARGEARVDVHDLRGRLVRTVFAGTAEAGRRACIWDGTAADGVAAGSGVYVYRVTAAGRTATGKLVLAR